MLGNSWSSETNRKFSLSRKELYPEIALIDPDLMLKKPRDLTLATALDALSHVIWNINANPAARFAVCRGKNYIT